MKNNTDPDRIKKKSYPPKDVVKIEEHMASCQKKEKKIFLAFFSSQEYNEQVFPVYIYQDTSKMLDENIFKISVSVNKSSAYKSGGYDMLLLCDLH